MIVTAVECLNIYFLGLPLFFGLGYVMMFKVLTVLHDKVKL